MVMSFSSLAKGLHVQGELGGKGGLDPKLSNTRSGEDWQVYDAFFKNYSRQGVFMEMGALDGHSLSTTYSFLEKGLDWKGFLMEAVPHQCGPLNKNRPTNTVNVCAAACEGDKKAVSLNIPAKGSTEVASVGNISQWGATKATDVPCWPLGSLLRASGIRFIDFWSLDVEGSEMTFLTTMDWTIPVYVVSVEVNWNSAEVENYLLKQGFVKHPWPHTDPMKINPKWSRPKVSGNMLNSQALWYNPAFFDQLANVQTSNWCDKSPIQSSGLKILDYDKKSSVQSKDVQGYIKFPRDCSLN